MCVRHGATLLTRALGDILAIHLLTQHTVPPVCVQAMSPRDVVRKEKRAESEMRASAAHASAGGHSAFLGMSEDMVCERSASSCRPLHLPLHRPRVRVPLRCRQLLCCCRLPRSSLIHRLPRLGHINHPPLLIHWGEAHPSVARPRWLTAARPQRADCSGPPNGCGKEDPQYPMRRGTERDDQPCPLSVHAISLVPRTHGRSWVLWLHEKYLS